MLALNGNDPFIMYGTGSLIGHTAFALWMDGEVRITLVSVILTSGFVIGCFWWMQLNVCESTGAANKPDNRTGVICTLYRDWISNGLKDWYVFLSEDQSINALWSPKLSLPHPPLGNRAHGFIGVNQRVVLWHGYRSLIKLAPCSILPLQDNLWTVYWMDRMWCFLDNLTPRSNYLFTS